MSRIDHVQRVIGELGAHIGRPELALDDDACLEIDLDGSRVSLMHATEPSELLWLFLDLGRVPDDPELLRGLLRLGFFAWVSNQMTLGLDNNGKRMIGYAAISVEALTADSLNLTLKRLVACGTDIVDRLARGDFDIETEATGQAHLSGSTGTPARKTD